MGATAQARLRAEFHEWETYEAEVTEKLDTALDLTDTNEIIENYRETIEYVGADQFNNEAREGMADDILYAYETAERELAERKAAERTRFEWKQLEKEHIRRVHDREDYEDWIKAFYKVGVISGKQAVWARDRIRECQAWNCENAFIARDLRAKYCCPACEREQNKAKARFKKTGTYMNKEMYIPKRTESINKARKRREVSLDAMSKPGEGLDIHEVIDENGNFTREHKPAPLIYDLVAQEMKKYRQEGLILTQKNPVKRRNKGTFTHS